ncbi:DUF4214 domain-containing protein [Pseudoduganella sp. SL102]|uniref:DUF4214 domain-containing protein n=1 Tax=Pseudoduganella sp. SL102 TaxID=2995154 RepID=UPI00248C9A3B|nr:DUF4214 domain-containing protein [Pseudoduganella sp. SL102]WBS04662.1 DUF4214 domain-containing protein [Pseudoduganella sp. SL102]
MPTYKTLDFLPDLSSPEMKSAIRLELSKAEDNSVGWDNSASYYTSEKYAILNSTFSFTAREGATYDIFSYSYFDPFLIQVYDSAGNVVAVNGPDITYGIDMVFDFVAPYSGTYYFSAGWDQGSYYRAVSVGVYENVDSIVAISPGTPPVTPPVPVPPTANVLKGGSGNDTFLATALEDRVSGGDGIDTIRYLKPGSDYRIMKNGAEVIVAPKMGTLSADTLESVENIQFSDTTVNLEYSDVTQALYIGYFGRAADPGALASFQLQLSALEAPTNVIDFAARYNSDPSVKALVDSFGTSLESKELYSGDTTSFVNAIYTNILDRAPDAEGLAFWTGAIDSGALSRANASISIMSGALANDSAQGRLDATLIDKKIDVATNFSLSLDTPAKAGSYAGTAAATLVRDLLEGVESTTNVLAYQDEVGEAVASLVSARPVAAADVRPDAGAAAVIGISETGAQDQYWL